VALYFKKFLREHYSIESDIIDLMDYQFPVFDERLKYQKDPSPQMLDFAKRIAEAEGIIIVCPEYNGGIPASLKNAIDFLYDEWYRKPVAITTVSSGAFGGSQVLLSLQFLLWKIKAWTIPALFPVPNVQSSFDESGTALDTENTNKRASKFIDELLWSMEAKRKMNSQ
jgi:NAD(P)H-dependent FMN reductase